MIRYVVVGVVCAIAGAGLMILLFLVANPIPSSLVCSVNGEGKVANCTDENGKRVDIPHDVRIR